MANRTHIFFAIVVVSLCWIVIAGDQQPSAAALPEPLRVHLKDERFDEVTSIRGLPLGVREEMQTLFASQTLDIADPGAQFQASTSAGTSTLPTRSVRNSPAARARATSRGRAG